LTYLERQKPTILPMSTKQTTTSHLKSLSAKKTMIYGIKNSGPDLEQAHKCVRVKPVNEWDLNPPSLD
jgi:hypothetical protein